ISRRLTKHSFYEAILLQDGHKLDHVVPPRDLRAWQQLPVSAIANRDPVVIEDLSQGTLKGLLERHTFKNFPVMQDGKLAGMLRRGEAVAALSANRRPKLVAAATCPSTQNMRDG